MKPFISWGAALGLSWAASAALAGGKPAITSRAPAAHELRLCSGGAESALGVDVLPTSIIDNGAGESLNANISLTSRFPNRAAVRHAVELVDDRGRAVLPPQLSLVRTLASAARSEASFATPAGLRDGYYMMRVTAAGTDGHEEASQIVETYLRVRAGGIEQIDSDEWFARSAANAGVRR